MKQPEVLLPVKWNIAGYVAGAFLKEDWDRAVDHIQVREPLAVGRLKRSPGDFLCKKGVVQARLVDAAAFAPETEITCSRCIAAAQRIAARFAR